MTNAHRLITVQGPPEEHVGKTWRRIVTIVRPVTGTCSACDWQKRGNTHRIVSNAFYREHIYPMTVTRGPD